jgi:hypothetical protein
MVRYLGDAYMYKNYPYYVPVITSAVNGCAIPVCLYYGGWIYGFICYMPIYLFFAMLSQPFITSGSSRPACGAAWAVITSCYVCYYTFLATSFPMWLATAIIPLLFAIVFTFVKSSITKPQHIVSASAADRYIFNLFFEFLSLCCLITFL